MEGLIDSHYSKASKSFLTVKREYKPNTFFEKHDQNHNRGCQVSWSNIKESKLQSVVHNQHNTITELSIRSTIRVSKKPTICSMVLRLQLIPAVTGGLICSDAESDLLALPVKFVCLSLQNVVQVANPELSNSKEIINDLTENVIMQNKEFQRNNENVNNIKKKLNA